MSDQLICGNTLDVLKTLDDQKVALSITSPPYNKQEKNKGQLVNSVVYDKFQDTLSESEYQSNQIDVLNEIYRVTIPGGSFFYNHKIRWHEGNMYHPMDWLRQSEWLIKQEIIWDRMIAGNIRGWRFWQVEERIYWLYKPNSNKIGQELRSDDAKLTSIWRGVPESGKRNPHPAPFPIWIPTRIITSLLGLGTQKTVLDPYVGSGTTVVATKALGHHYIGIDISQSYLEMSQTRIKNISSELQKIRSELLQHNMSPTSIYKYAENEQLQLDL